MCYNIINHGNGPCFLKGTDMFRDLKASEIECRIGTVSQSGKGLSLLLFKTARVDYDILDETVGPMGWQCKYYEQKGTLFCSIGIMSSTGEWIWKDNAGARSNMEAEKGEASDAMKRAGFVWGIGRELYTAPFIWVPAEKLINFGQKNGKFACNDRFEVAKIAIENKVITGVRIVNQSGEVVFSWRRKVDDGE